MNKNSYDEAELNKERQILKFCPKGISEIGEKLYINLHII